MSVRCLLRMASDLTPPVPSPPYDDEPELAFSFSPRMNRTLPYGSFTSSCDQPALLKRPGRLCFLVASYPPVSVRSPVPESWTIFSFNFVRIEPIRPAKRLLFVGYILTPHNGRPLAGKSTHPSFPSIPRLPEPDSKIRTSHVPFFGSSRFASGSWDRVIL